MGALEFVEIVAGGRYAFVFFVNGVVQLWDMNDALEPTPNAEGNGNKILATREFDTSPESYAFTVQGDSLDEIVFAAVTRNP